MYAKVLDLAYRRIFSSKSVNHLSNTLQWVTPQLNRFLILGDDRQRIIHLALGDVWRRWLGRRRRGWGDSMDAITSLMYQSSTLIGSIILVGVLAYLGTNAISPSNVILRRMVGYLAGAAMVAIGAFSLYFGASYLLTNLFAHIYIMDVNRLEWSFIGGVSIIVGLLLVRQAFRRM